MGTKLHIFTEKSLHLNLFSYFCTQINDILWKLNAPYYSFPTMTAISQRVSESWWRWSLISGPRKPDMVIGGINHGDNGSVNTHYSGTMGVVLEGCMKYIPSVAFSLCDHREDADFEPLRPLIRQITQRVLAEGLPLGVCLNVNFPLVDVFKGVRVCRMAKGTWGNEVSKCHHPRGYDYWWMVGHYQNDEPEAEDTDNWALSHGYVAITPTQIDVTAYQALDLIKGWRLTPNL